MKILPFLRLKDSSPQEGEDLTAQIYEVQLEVYAAKNLFLNTANPLQTDQAILLEEAAGKRYSYTMKKIRAQKINAKKLIPLRPWYIRAMNLKE